MDSMRTLASFLAASSRVGFTSVAFMLAERSISRTYRRPGPRCNDSTGPASANRIVASASS